MATSGVINGKLFGVYIDGTLIGLAKSADISLSHEVRDTTTKDDDGWKTIAEGGRSWTAKTDNLVSFSATYNYEELFDLVTNRTEVTISFETNVSGDSRMWGRGYISSLDLNAPNQESVSFTASFEGDGVLTKVAHT